MPVEGVVVAGAGLVAIAIAVWWWSRPSAEPPVTRLEPRPASTPPAGPVITLEQQIDDLAGAGLKLNPGVCVDDFLTSFSRAEFEGDPYRLLIIMHGFEIEREPSGRLFSDGAWSFDLECIEGRGSYVRIVNELARLAGGGLVKDVSDEVDLTQASGSVNYTIAGVRKTLPVEINNDWADTEAARLIMSDIADAVNDGRRFFGADNGQALTLFFISDEVAARVNKLAEGTLLAPV
ncbi:MAG: hypothetical protein JNK07_05330 [Alphaproteobacteria bacterium]|nr:hypothetical protein [Alphaproteobacteria bacterium]